MAITIDARNAGRPGRVLVAAGAARVSQRARAFAAARRHSRLVALLRIVCPLAAAALLGAYALIVAMSWASNAGKFKVGSVEITADDLTMKDPSYFDVTRDGRYEVRARRAVVSFGQSKNTPIKLIDVSGEMVQNSGTVTKLKAKHGLFDNAKGELQLLDGVEIDGSDGVMARLSRATIYSKESKVVSVDPVSANMPTGSIRAAAMTMNTKTRLVQFRGDVSVRLAPQQGRTLGAGKDARRPVDIRAEELDIDDAAKAAHFRGKVVAIQGETMLQAPYLLVKYEGKAAAAPAAGKNVAGEGAQVTFLWARNGVEVTAGTDRRITSDLVDFDVAADTAVFAGNVAASQDKNVLKGGRLLIDRKAGRSRLETPGENGRIAATFHQGGASPAPQAKRPSAMEEVQKTMLGSFKADRRAPMDVQADALDLLDASSKAVFRGDVVAHQGGLLLRTAELTAFYSGQSGMSFTNPADGAGPEARARAQGEIVRLEARHSVIMSSKDQTASAKWADFNVKANTALLGGGVTVTRPTDDPLKPDVVRGERLKVDLSTGISEVEAAPGSAPQRRPPLAEGGTPATLSGPAADADATPAQKVEACPPGRTCILLHPKKVREKAMDVLKKRAPSADVH